jgi:predicted DNA-binding transcriptional regulator YafY
MVSPRTERVRGAKWTPITSGTAGGGLYLIGYCHLRKDVRLFAVKRIHSITLTDHPYQMPLGFNVEDHVQDALMS